MNVEEDDPPASLRAAGERLGHIHLADSNRAHPGTGHVDFGAALVTLEDIGFDGYMALECGLRGDPEVVLPEVAGFLKGLSP
jgi:sugar phosphate isomerase/epimerase